MQSYSFIPFGLLLPEVPKNSRNFSSYPYWIKDKKIGYAFSLRVLETQIPNASQPSPPKRLLAIAPSAPLASQPTSEHRTNYGLTDRLSLLINSKEEVHRIADLWEGDVITGDEATKEVFCTLMPYYKLLHIATHGQSDTPLG
jgi:CHAT domain-containing protein